jgi:hypothetical protein
VQREDMLLVGRSRLAMSRYEYLARVLHATEVSKQALRETRIWTRRAQAAENGTPIASSRSSPIWSAMRSRTASAPCV